MHAPGFDGKMLLSCGPVFARPRLPALTALAPEPGHSGSSGRDIKDITDQPRDDLQQVSPMSGYNILSAIFPLT